MWGGIPAKVKKLYKKIGEKNYEKTKC